MARRSVTVAVMLWFLFWSFTDIRAYEIWDMGHVRSVLERWRLSRTSLVTILPITTSGRPVLQISSYSIYLCRIGKKRSSTVMFRYLPRQCC